MGWLSVKETTLPFDLEKGKEEKTNFFNVNAPQNKSFAGTGSLPPEAQGQSNGSSAARSPENHKKKSNKKPPKPPKPPRSSLPNEADEKLMKEISELAMLKRARIERLKALKRMKDSKASSSPSYGNFFATIFTIFFCLLIMFQGMPPKLNITIPVSFRSLKPVRISGNMSSGGHRSSRFPHLMERVFDKRIQT